MTWVQVDVPEELWEKYKGMVSRNITLEKSIVILVEHAVEKGDMITNGQN